MSEVTLSEIAIRARNSQYYDGKNWVSMGSAQWLGRKILISLAKLFCLDFSYIIKEECIQNSLIAFLKDKNAGKEFKYCLDNSMFPTTVRKILMESSPLFRSIAQKPQQRTDYRVVDIKPELSSVDTNPEISSIEDLP